MTQGTAPLVSIGIPVYNGAKYLKETLDSILSQTFTDFEVIVSDNASTDSTREIVESYAAKDSRIRYYRNAENIGAAPNYNRTFELSRGKYFRWHAHDDLIAPTYLEKCVAVMELDSGIVLAHARTQVIDEKSQPFEFTLKPDGSASYSASGANGLAYFYGVDVYDRKLDSPNAPLRFYGATNIRWCYEIFGLMRADALRRTKLQENFYGTDLTLLVEMAALGRFYIYREPLFLNRRHPEQSTSLSTKQRHKWNNGKNAMKMPVRMMRLRGYLRAIHQSDMTARERLMAYGYLVRRYADVARYKQQIIRGIRTKAAFRKAAEEAKKSPLSANTSQ